jgi:hypothetical protein
MSSSSGNAAFEMGSNRDLVTAHCRPDANKTIIQGEKKFHQGLYFHMGPRAEDNIKNTRIGKNHRDHFTQTII